MNIGSYGYDIDKAFKEARDSFRQSQSVLDLAIIHQQRDESGSINVSDVTKFENIARVKKATEDLRNNYTKAWEGFDRKCAELRKDLEKKLSEHYCAKPEDLDTNALELLKSGAMSVDDFHHFEKKYANNHTMLKLLSGYAKQQAEGMEDKVGRIRLSDLAKRCAESGTAELRAFDELVFTAHYCSGRGSVGNPRPFNASTAHEMMGHWENQYEGIMKKL